MKRQIILIITSIILLIMSTYNILIYIQIQTNHTEYKNYPEYSYVERDAYIEYFESQKKYIPNTYSPTEIVNLLSLPSYSIHYRTFNNNKSGFSYILLKQIYLDKDILKTSYDYIVTLVHETLHIYTKTAQERYIQYQTFLYLYNSPAEVLHQASIYFLLDILKGYYILEYDCSPYIIQYLNTIDIL